MKKLNRLIATLLLAGTASASMAATSLKASVNGMVCAFCAQGIEKRLSALPATQAVFVDLAGKAGFSPPEIVEMPANNLSLLFERL